MKKFFKQTKAEKYTKIIVIIFLVSIIGYKFIERMTQFIELGK